MNNNENQNVRLVKYNGEVIPVDAGVPIDEIKRGMARMYPELADAIAHENAETGVITFYVEAGDKGSDGENVRLVKYNGEVIPVDAGVPIDEIKRGMARMYPELADAIAHENAETGVITFYVEAGDKGSEGENVRLVKYNGEVIPVDAGVPIDEIKRGMARMYPELADAIAHENAETGVITFYVEAGDKGNI